MSDEPKFRSQAVFLFACVTTFLASVGLNLQIRANSALAMEGVPPTRIALVNMLLQLAMMVLVLIAARPVRRAFHQFVVAFRNGKVKPWWFVGGLVGALVITLMGVVTPLVGVAVFSIALVAGQTTSSLSVDRWGLGPGGRRQLTVTRVLAAVLAVTAVVVSVSDRFVPDGRGELAWGAAGLAFLGGLAISFQAAANGQIAKVSGQPSIGAGVNFAVGTLVLTLVSVFTWATNTTSASGAGTWWLYLGSVFGLFIVLNTAWAVRYLGILLLTVIGVLGQMAGALAMDILFPTPGIVASPALIGGVLLAVVAVVVGTSAQWRRGAGTRARAPRS